MNVLKKFAAETGAPLADAEKVLDLKTAEILTLWTIRSWVWSTVEHGDPGRQYQHGLARAGCADAAPAFAGLLDVIGGTATRRIQIYKPCCTEVGEDEKRFLHILGAQQNGRVLEAFDVLTHLLPGAAIRISLKHAEAAAQCLARAGLFLPDRAWNLEELSLTHRLRAPQATTVHVRYMLH